MMKYINQFDAMDCGPSCLGMISSHYGKEIDLQYLREKCNITKEGVSLLGIDDAAREIGFETFSASLKTEDLKKISESNFPCILHWNNNHFVVLRKYNSKAGWRGHQRRFQLADPSHGFVNLDSSHFKKSWAGGNEEGVALFLKPTEKFYSTEFKKSKELSLRYLLKYFKPHKKQLSFIFILMLIGSLATMIFPFLTQYLIDRGISEKDVDYVQFILFSQLSLYLGVVVMEIFRNWMSLIVGTKISINIISEFLTKMLQLPVKFFDTKLIGDFQQRIQDNNRVESFLTSQTLVTFFSFVTLSVFFIVLAYYNWKILGIYVGLTVIAIGWSLYFLKKRKILDYHRFVENGNNQETIYEMLNGVTEMKLNNYEDFKREKWYKIQEKLFFINKKILKLDQLQISGFTFINHLKNIIVSYYTAVLVIQGEMSLGILLSVSYIVGMMNSPINQLINFFRSFQDAKLSLSRLNEVQDQEPEERDRYVELPNDEETFSGIQMNKVSFHYEGPRSPKVLDDISLEIPKGKVTAIVGASGSGKSTLMKLLLRFYEPSEGSIHYQEKDINDISPKNLRTNCGVVMQDGFIFSDTIERNIATKDELIDIVRVRKAARVANIDDYVQNLPQKYKTKIGAAGSGLSGGQKQRILIARAVYKNPQYVFFDEATSALDSQNERIIHENLFRFFKGKTVLIIAHRLSTVKNADQVIVLKNGKLMEKGTHEELVNSEGEYFNLVKNQLELGN